MTTAERRIVAPLLDEAAAIGGGEAVVRWLWREGLLDIRGAERRAICREVDRRVRRGQGRCRAMDEVADRYGCSYEKVRAAVYAKRGE